MKKNSKLQMMQESVQEIAEATASAMKLEVEIFDDKLVVVGATGRIRGKIGFTSKTAHVTRQVIKSGNSYAVEEPGQHELCRKCAIKNNCFCTAALVCPISLSGQILGTFSLLSFDEQQKKDLITRQNQYFDFMSRMGDLIANRAQLLEVMDQIAGSEKYLKTIIDSVSEGIIAVDAEANISFVNNVVERLFGCERDYLIGQPVTAVFPNSSLPETILKQIKLSDQETEVIYRDTKVRLVCRSAPIFKGKEVLGAVKTFKDVKTLPNETGVNQQQPSRVITFEDIKGKSKVMKNLIAQAHIVAKGNSTILLRGESGTGKELFAQAIHQVSRYQNGPFQAINCSAIPENLLESELFGYEEGAFTGARKGGKPGKFELADGGTLFLDEIGDMPLTLQAKLLRVLESNRLERVGGNKEYSFNVRIIAATNRNLEEMVDSKQFRADLYYRLNVIPLFIPSLRHRREDILFLASLILKKYNGRLGKNIAGFEQEAQDLLLGYHWPGNVRELENVTEYAVNFEHSNLITTLSLPQWIKQNKNSNNTEEEPASLKDRTASAEQEIIRQMLLDMGDSVKTKKAIAEHLGISLTTLYRKLKAAER